MNTLVISLYYSVRLPPFTTINLLALLVLLERLTNHVSFDKTGRVLLFATKRTQ